MKARYSHQWLIHQERGTVWNYFTQCLENSAKVKEWPNQFVTLRNLGSKLSLHSFEEATYKIGSYSTTLPYEIVQVLPGKKIVYRAGKGHPLAGQSVIEFKEVEDGTLFHWHGAYRAKTAMANFSLLWFKLFFERMFFSDLHRKTRDLKTVSRSKGLRKHKQRVSPGRQTKVTPTTKPRRRAA